MRQYATFLLAFLGLLLRSGLALRRQLPPSRITSRGMISVDSLLTAVEVVTKPDGYVYGAVEAPPIIPIVGALVVILLAGLPILLRPGESALEQQRADEESTNSKFGGGDSVSKNRKGKV